MAESSGYEKRDVNSLVIIGVAAFIVLVLVGIVVILSDYFIHAKEEMIYNSQLRPESAELREIRAQETEKLNNYGVVDKQKAVYRIPIDRAMRLMSEEAFRERLQEDQTSR